MKKHLFSNWVNIIGIIIGLFILMLFIALYLLLFVNKRGFTFETVILESIGGPILQTYGTLVHYILPLGIYTLLMLSVDATLYIAIKDNLNKILIIEIIISSSLFIYFSQIEGANGFLILPITFVFSQWIRRKNLNYQKEKTETNP